MPQSIDINSRGIVLRKHFPRMCMVSLLDEQYGHIKAIPSCWQVASCVVPGSLITYEIAEQRGALFINQIELCCTPSYSHESTLIFLHHLLELCGVCLPVRGGRHDAFALMLEIIATLDNIGCNEFSQQIALAKLLFLSGHYPDGIDRLSISTTLYKTYNELKETMFNDAQRRELAIFIYQCLAQHPAGKWLKTVNFLPWDKP